MSSTAWPDPFAARDVVVGSDLGRDRLEDRFDGRPSRFATAGHKARSLERSFFSTRNTRSDEQEPFAFDLLGPTFGIDVMGISTVDENIARLEVGCQLIDQIVDGWTSLDEHHHHPRSLEVLDHLWDRVATDEVLALGSRGHQLVDFFGGAIEDRHAVATALDVQSEVLAHNSQSNQSEIAQVAHLGNLNYFLSWGCTDLIA